MGQFSRIETPYAPCLFDIPTLSHGIKQPKPCQEVDDEALAHGNDSLSLPHSKFQLACRPLRLTEFLVWPEDDGLMPKDIRAPIDPRIGFARFRPSNLSYEEIRETPMPIIGHYARA